MPIQKLQTVKKQGNYLRQLINEIQSQFTYFPTLHTCGSLSQTKVTLANNSSTNICITTTKVLWYFWFDDNNFTQHNLKVCSGYKKNWFFPKMWNFVNQAVKTKLESMLHLQDTNFWRNAVFSALVMHDGKLVISWGQIVQT